MFEFAGELMALDGHMGPARFVLQFDGEPGLNEQRNHFARAQAVGVEAAMVKIMTLPELGREAQIIQAAAQMIAEIDAVDADAGGFDNPAELPEKFRKLCARHMFEHHLRPEKIDGCIGDFQE